MIEETSEVDPKVNDLSLINFVGVVETSISNAELMSPVDVQSVNESMYRVVE